MKVSATHTLIEAITERRRWVQEYLFEDRNRLQFSFKHLEDAVYSYLRAGGKSMRPAVLLFACGAVGGDERKAIPAAATVELYHTFTLVHDDIIDRDEMRRGVPTVHAEFSRRGQTELGFDSATADHYGTVIAILAGDLQQGWAASILPDLHYSYGLPAQLPLHLIKYLFHHTQQQLINGETLDVMQAETPITHLSEQEVLDMLWQKTGVLYEFAGLAGAAIGIGHPNFDHPAIKAVGDFAGKCGIAFQLQDDVLGIIGDQKRTGKSVGADVREGKRTVILLHSFDKMSPTEKDFTLRTLGNTQAPDEDIDEIISLMQKHGGIEHARQLASDYIEQGLEHLNTLPDSEARSLLASWADYIVARDR